MSWAQENATGQLDTSHFARAEDVTELYTELNRRRVIYFNDSVPVVAPSGYITAGRLVDLREDVLDLLPQSYLRDNMRWVWPLADADENKLLVANSSSDPAEVGLLEKIGSPSNEWIRDPAAPDPIHAEDINELRLALERVCRVKTIECAHNTASISTNPTNMSFPDLMVSNNASEEVRAIGQLVMRSGTPPQGMGPSVTVLDNSTLEVFSDEACTLDIYHVATELDYDGSYPTWDDATDSLSWTGGLGLGATLLTQIGCTANDWTEINFTGLVALLQSSADNDTLLNFLFVSPGSLSALATLDLRLTAFYQLNPIID